MPSFGFELNNLPSLGPMPETHNAAPESAEDFAQRIILAVCSASVTTAVGRRIHERCLRALSFGATARLAIRHPGKAAAIDRIWCERERLYQDYLASSDKYAFLATLPWIGPVTKHALARRLGLPDLPRRRAVA